MEVGGFKRVVIQEDDSQLDINSKVVNSVNINFDKIYKAMTGGIDFSTNVNCGLISIPVQHGQEQNINHGLTNAPKSVIVLSGLVKIVILSSSLSGLKIRTYLPQTFLTSSVNGNSLTVSDPYSYSVGDVIVIQRTGNFEPVEALVDSIELKSRTLKIKTSVQAAAFDVVYKKQDNIKLMVF